MHPPTTLFLDPPAVSPDEAADHKAFLAWIQAQDDRDGRPVSSAIAVQKAFQRDPGATIADEITKNDYGMVLIGRNPGQAWQERLCYRLRHKVIGLITPNRHLRRIAVLVDFSEASLLVLAFCRRTFMFRPDVRVRFLHVLRDDPRRVIRRWSRLKQAADLDAGEPLKIIPATESVAAAILEALAAGGEGTVIMGKRGLSGIKRFLLGRVSRGVLRGSGEFSLFLVD